MEFLFFIFPLLLIFGTHRIAVKPFLSGDLEIDKNLFPTLERAQRILRARNAKARARELTAKITSLRADTDHEIYNSQKIALDSLNETRKKHKDSLNEWDFQFKELTRPAVERQRAERMKEIMAEQESQRALAKEAMYDTWRTNEAMYNAKAAAWSSNTDYTVKYDTRLIDPNMRVNVRSQPHTKAPLWGILLPSTAIEVVGWIRGESLKGRDIWFKVITPDSSEAYIWGGTLINQSTVGLTDLNELQNPAHKQTNCVCPGCYEYEYEQLSHRTEMKSMLSQQAKSLPKKKNNTGFEHQSSSMFSQTKFNQHNSWELYDQY